MAVLVTGATGLLGNNLVRDLLAQGEQVRVLARDKGMPKSLAGLEVEVVRGDVRDADSIRRAVEGMQTVYHSAGFVHIGWSQSDVHEAINVEGTRSIAKEAQRVGARLVYVSSINALGVGSKDFTATEDTALPDVVPCPYVTSKARAEKIVLERVNEGLNAVIVNPGFMLGPWDWKPSSGRMMLEISSRFAPIAPCGSLTCCDVRDVSAGTLSAAQQGISGRHYILGGHHISYFELWRQMAGLAGKAGPKMKLGPLMRWGAGAGGDLWYRLSGKEPDVNSAGVRMSNQHHRFSSQRAMEELQYKVRPWEQTLQDAWAWFLQHGYVK